MKKMKDMDKMLDKTLDVLVEGETKLELFKGKNIRAIFYQNEWHYSIIDIISAITESNIPRNYWSDLKRQLIEKEGFFQLHGKIVQLKMKSKDGKMRQTDTADVETIFRIIQSIPNKKAEIFKRWLARVGYERIQEIQNPEIGIKRNIAQYKAQGRSEEWIKSRVKGTLTRNELTDEWEKRGVEGIEYGMLTNEISKGAFEVTTKQHKEYKKLKKNHSLRDNMSTLELAIMNLGEAATAEITKSKNAQGFDENLNSAKDGGSVAGKARQDIEKRTGKPVLTKRNFLSHNNEKLPISDKSKK